MDKRDIENSEQKVPKRYNLYDQININEKYLDYFIVGVVVLLMIVIVVGII